MKDLSLWLKESSTKRAIVLLLGIVGLQYTETGINDAMETLASVIMGLIAIVEFLHKEYRRSRNERKVTDGANAKGFAQIGMVLVILLVSVTLIMGCKTSWVTLKKSEDCIDRTQYPNSLILAKIPHVCRFHSVFVAAVQADAVLSRWNSDDFDRFHAWIGNKVRYLDGARFVSAAMVKNVILGKLAEYNDVLGAGAFILTDTLLAFSDEMIFEESDDLKVLKLALKDLDLKMRALALFQANRDNRHD